MKDLIAKFPNLKAQVDLSTDVRFATDIVIELFGEKKRLSDRWTAEHSLETAEFAAYFTSNPVYLISALLHDFQEDLGFTFADINSISGKNGSKVAKIVSTLSKQDNIENRLERNNEYTDRISRAISQGKKGVGLIKLCDRLSNLTDLYAHAPLKRLMIARETISFYLPIAKDMKLANLARNLELLSFQHINPI